LLDCLLFRGSIDVLWNIRKPVPHAQEWIAPQAGVATELNWGQASNLDKRNPFSKRRWKRRAFVIESVTAQLLAHVGKYTTNFAPVFETTVEVIRIARSMKFSDSRAFPKEVK
jgi:hypothetical protein